VLRPLYCQITETTDQVDSTAQMLDWFKRGAGPTSNAGIFELTRQLARRRALRRRSPNHYR
jgi:hypothetical protein